MKGDFTRETFDPTKNYRRVLMQQGRVQLDADWNEQGLILHEALRGLAADLIGPHGGPRPADGTEAFLITALDSNGSALTEGGQVADLSIGPGRYYVAGLPVESLARANADGNPIPLRWSMQPGMPSPLPALPALPFLVYLDVWERHVTADEDARLAEVALGGPDTATRAQLVWQVRAIQPPNFQPGNRDGNNAVNRFENYDEFLNLLREAGVYEIGVDWLDRNLPASITKKIGGTGRLSARAKVPDDATLTEPCLISPDAQYRGTENRLYRVEVHAPTSEGKATFKWSRENGSVVFPVVDLATDSASSTTTLTLAHLGRDRTLSLAVGDWVEVVDDDYALRFGHDPLLQVSDVRPEEITVTLGADYTGAVGKTPGLHPVVRRWDQKAGSPKKGGLQIADGAAVIVQDGTWLELEDGVQVQFTAGEYRSGDYWLIPARVATGDIEWPPAGRADPVLPQGVTHYYAPLAIVAQDAAGTAGSLITDCRRFFAPLAALL